MNQASSAKKPIAARKIYKQPVDISQKQVPMILAELQVLLTLAHLMFLRPDQFWRTLTGQTEFMRNIKTTYLQGKSLVLCQKKRYSYSARIQCFARFIHNKTGHDCRIRLLYKFDPYWLFTKTAETDHGVHRRYHADDYKPLSTWSWHQCLICRYHPNNIRIFRLYSRYYWWSIYTTKWLLKLLSDHFLSNQLFLYIHLSNSLVLSQV